MRLNKKFNNEVTASARYVADGISLSMSGKDDWYANSIAVVECVDGEIRLTLLDDAIERYGVKINHENIAPATW